MGNCTPPRDVGNTPSLRRPEGALTRPNKMPRIGLFQSRIAGLGEAQPLTASVAHICSFGGHKLQIVSVKPEYPQ